MQMFRLALFSLGYLLFLYSPLHAADRVLIMAIADYERYPLPGAKIDRQNVRDILRLMDIHLDHVRTLGEQEQNAKSIKMALAELSEQTEPGDRVFIFFSGHGTSRLIDGRCQQALIAKDMYAVNPAEINQALTTIKDKASKVVMVVDACHSGGVVEATRSSGSNRLKAKFVSPDNPAEQCSKPVNIIEERISTMRSTRGAPLASNYLYVAAAKANEVAFDDPVKGGLATSSLLACLKAGVPDEDRSGSVSFRELARCAQGQIDDYLKDDRSNRPHHLHLAGNPELPIVSRAAANPASKPSAADPVATLRDLLQAADARWSVKIDAKPAKARIGKDAFRLAVSSSESGYLTLLYVGSDGKEFLQLFPEKTGEAIRVNAGKPFQIPGEFAAHGPAGINRVLAMVSDTPRDFSSVFGQQGSASASLSNASALQESTRNLKHRPNMGNQSALYGAALIDLIEE